MSESKAMKLIKDIGMKYYNEHSNRKHRFGIYECPICLKHFETQSAHVKNGSSTKCRSCASKTHGIGTPPIYSIWVTMKGRCTNEKHKRFHRYGGRGITICDEWLNDFKSFYDWSIVNGYKEGLSIDRIDNDGNYEPSNCQWITVSDNIRKSNIENPRNKICIDVASEICEAYATGIFTLSEIARYHKVGISTISRVVKSLRD